MIAADGSVAADTGAVAASLDNHLDREEVEAALKGGSGYAIRHSATLGRTMLYVAMRSAHSDNVLRLAVPYSGMREYLPLLFPAAMGSFMLALACSIAATERFVSSVTRPLRVISREMLKVRGFGLRLDRFNHFGNSFIDTTFQIHRICSGSNILQTYPYD